MGLINQGQSQLNNVSNGTMNQQDALKSVHECFSAVNELSKTDPMLSSLVGQLQTRRTELFQYTQKAAATRAGRVVGEGSKELRSRAGVLWNSPELAQVK